MPGDLQGLLHILEGGVGLVEESIHDPFAKLLIGIVIHLEDLLERALVDVITVFERLAGVGPTLGARRGVAGFVSPNFSSLDLVEEKDEKETSTERATLLSRDDRRTVGLPFPLRPSFCSRTPAS